MTASASPLSPRSRRLRRRVLEVVSRQPAAHVAPAFSCLEVVDAVYSDLMRPGDAFVMSKGHGYLAQLVVLEDLGRVSRADLDAYCTPGAPYGAHPDRGTPGIELSTGSLGHGLGMAVGMALADRSAHVWVVASDGELQEGSTWEAATVAASLGVDNLTLLVDNNDLVSATRISEAHRAVYPIAEKFTAFGWAVSECDGHSRKEILEAASNVRFDAPLAVVCRTVKGRGLSFMEGQGVFHYRGITAKERAVAEEELR